MDSRDEKLKALAAASHQGDERAARELFRAIRGDVHRILVATVGDDPELDDMLQVAFIELFRSLGNFRGQSLFRTWMYRVVVNVAFGQLRRRRRQVGVQLGETLSPEWPTPLADPEVHSEQRERLRQVREALGELSPKMRLVFVLHDVEGHDVKEIAAIVGINRFTVKSRLFYARREFARHLRKLALLESGRAAALPRTEPDEHER